jgi:hypothetical protein
MKGITLRQSMRPSIGSWRGFDFPAATLQVFGIRDEYEPMTAEASFSECKFIDKYCARSS